MNPKILSNQTLPLILLIEDNEDHAELIKRSFSENRVANKITWLNEGEIALQYLFREGNYKDPLTSPVPDLILLDLNIPKVNGFEVLRHIKSNPELLSVPVVILTSSAAEADIKRSYEAHANSYVVKPIDFLKFTELMDNLGLYWLCWNQHPILNK